MPNSKPTQRARILLVDDEPSIRAVYPEVLGVDYDVSVAATGREALAILSERADFDVIVCDLTMPDVDGPAFYDALRSRGYQRLDRVIFCSGGLVTTRLREFAASIPNIFLEKPIAVETLVAAMDSVVRRAKGAAAG